MQIIEKISNYIAIKVSKALELDIDRQEVLSYGAFSILQTLWSVSLIMIFGMIFDVFWEAIFISASGAMLRKYSGGAHATSPNRCAIIGVLTSVGSGLILSKWIDYVNIKYIYLYVFIVFIITYYVVYQYSPVDSPNKPIIKEATKKRLRKASFNMIHFFAIIIVTIYVFYSRGKSHILLLAILSICTGILWQDISLIPLGHNLIAKIDLLLKKIFD